MKFAIVFLVTLLIMAPLVPTANAQPPLNGTYQSTDLGGTMLPGRYSESWTAAAGHLTLGNTTNKFSWDGFTLGTQWWMYCAQISAVPILLQDTVNINGDGIKQYVVNYTGGLCILGGSGPWGGGDPSYTAPYTAYAEIKTFQYANNVLVAVISTVQMQAMFLGFNDDCMSLAISNQEQAPLGSTDHGPLPANYPGFLDPNTCAPTRTLGSWGEADEFTLIIQGCTIPTEEATWGSIKAIYGND
jgi:hypothetical protein